MRRSLVSAIPRHRRYVASLGLQERCAGDRAIELGVAELQQEERVMRRMSEVGAASTQQDGADVLVLRCAGMARYRAELEARLGVAVVDPCQAAAALAVQTVCARRAEAPTALAAGAG